MLTSGEADSIAHGLSVHSWWYLAEMWTWNPVCGLRTESTVAKWSKACRRQKAP